MPSKVPDRKYRRYRSRLRYCKSHATLPQKTNPEDVHDIQLQQNQRYSHVLFAMYALHRNFWTTLTTVTPWDKRLQALRCFTARTNVARTRVVSLELVRTLVVHGHAGSSSKLPWKINKWIQSTRTNPNTFVVKLYFQIQAFRLSGITWLCDRLHRQGKIEELRKPIIRT